MTFVGIKVLHFVGIGGSGMSGIAEILLRMGYQVTGSDMASSRAVMHLEEEGARVVIGHAEENIGSADVVIVSTAVRDDNPEVIGARKRHIPVIPRAEMLAELMRLKYSVAVAGSHGKTTTTSMTAQVLTKCGLDPTIIIGGRVDRLGSGAHLGESDYLVAEADESDGSFLTLYPTVAVLTNIDKEHTDHYGSFENVKKAFSDFANKVPFYGATILCLDDQNLQNMIPDLKKRFMTYGLSKSADVTGRDIRFEGFKSSFTLCYKGEEVLRTTIAMPGIHNVRNALAAISTGIWLGIDPIEAAGALESFAGIERRLELKGEVGGVMVLDDYGHHPSEIKATLRAIREGFPGRRLVVCFQPHRYTRTLELMEEFHTSFYDADDLTVTAVYSAGQQPIEGASGEKIAEGVLAHGNRDVRYIGELDDLLNSLVTSVKVGDVVITLGAGSISTIGGRLVASLEKRERE